MDNELETLINQRRELDEKIKMLKTRSISEGVCRIGMEHYATDKPDRWYLGMNTRYINYDYGFRQQNRFRCVINAGTKEDVVNAIPELIRDLQALYDKAVSE